MKSKTIIIIVIALIAIPIAWYLISPIFRVVELEEESPFGHKINDALDTMDAVTKAEFEKQVDSMQGQVIVMDDVMPAGPKIISQGNFKPRAHEVEGKALLLTNGKKVLRLENFNTINGPNLHVYLSTKLGDDDFIDLGKLKATKGSFNYELDNTIDTDKYSKVLVWCVPFGVLFSYAELD